MIGTMTRRWPPVLPLSPRWRSWWCGLFGSPGNTLITLVVLAVLYWIAGPILRWAVIDATWSGSAESCARNSGACWAFIGAKFRFILFGLYPPDQQGRALTALLAMFGLIGVTAVPRFWHRHLPTIWVATLAVVIAVMAGGAILPPIPTDKWGGFSLTLLIFLTGFAVAFPLGVLLALGRRSRMGGIRLLSILVIEVTRGVPFIVILYAATLLFPLMLPVGAGINKLLRAETAIAVFIAAFLAETIRGGLQAIPRGQYEAARGLGLSYAQTMRLVILPQALRLVIPGIVSIALGIFQDTTLIIVIGMFDFLNAARTAAADPTWLGFYDEAYAFTALVYFLLCFAASRYSLWLERHVMFGKT
jgi:general L-amino acid transport system permease protein